MCVLTHTYQVFKASGLYLPQFPADCDTENYPPGVMRPGTREAARGQGKTEISLERDQWSCMEKRLIELRRGGRKEQNSGGGGAWLRRLFSVHLVQIEDSDMHNCSFSGLASGVHQRPAGVQRLSCTWSRLDAPVHPSHGCSPDYAHYCSITRLSL